MLSRRPHLLARSGLLAAALSSLAGCGDGDTAGAGDDPPVEEEDGGGVEQVGPLVVDTDPADHDIDLFGGSGHRFWIEVSEDQLRLMNERSGGGGPGPIFMERAGHRPLSPAYDVAADELPGDPGYGGDIYTPGGDAEAATFADVVIQDAPGGKVADYGKLEVRLIGESTSRQWTSRTIPNVRIDTNEFQDGMRIGGFEHLRLNNGLVGSIFREHIALRIFRELGYPALRSSFAFLGSNVWGEETWIPMTLTEVYKRRFCTDHEQLIGGKCTNMWEYPGDAGSGELLSNACQVDECDDQRMQDLADALASTPPGPGFGDALADIIDWPMFHRFQCLGWILATGDDALRNSNNNLIIQRDTDDKLVFAPYSIDISAGQEWYPNPPLLGSSAIAAGCQADPACWAGTVAACEALIGDFDALNPEDIVDETTATHTAQGMMRTGDEERAVEIREWYVQRQGALAAELEKFRYLPDTFGVCPNELVACNDGGCGTVADCEARLCTPPMVWCEAMQQCIEEQWQQCVTCEGDASFYCPVNSACVADMDACSLECELTAGPGYVYCPAISWCELPFVCDGGEPLPAEPDGGIIIGPLPAEPDGGLGLPEPL